MSPWKRVPPSVFPTAAGATLSRRLSKMLPTCLWAFISERSTIMADLAAVRKDRHKRVGASSQHPQPTSRVFSVRRACALCTLSAAIVIAPAVSAEFLSDAEVKKLVSIWRSQNHGVRTAKIKMRVFRLTTDETEKLGNEGLDRVVSLLQNGDVDGFVLAVKRVIPAADLDQLVYFGNTVEIIQEGAKLRNRRLSRNTSDTLEIAVYNGSEEIRLDTANRQANLYTGISPSSYLM